MFLHSLSLLCVSIECPTCSHAGNLLEEHADAAVEVDAGANGQAAELVEGSALGEVGDEVLTDAAEVTVAAESAGFVLSSGSGDVVRLILRSGAGEDSNPSKGDDFEVFHRDVGVVVD